MKIEVELELPKLPNFLRFGSDLNTGTELTVDVGNLNKDQIEAVIDAWGYAFETHCASRRGAERDGGAE